MSTGMSLNDPGVIFARQVSDTFAAEVSGVDLVAPMPTTTFERILEIFYRYRVIFFPRQAISPRQLADFASKFGELENYHLADFMLPEVPQVRIISNEIVDGRNVGATGAGMSWHSDLSYRPRPAGATLLYGLVCPSEGGNTKFADMVAAYAALPEDTKKKIAGLRTVRDRSYRYSEFYPQRPSLTKAQTDWCICRGMIGRIRGRDKSRGASCVERGGVYYRLRRITSTVEHSFIGKRR